MRRSAAARRSLLAPDVVGKSIVAGGMVLFALVVEARRVRDRG